MYTIWDVEHAGERIADYLWKPILFIIYYFVRRSESEYLLTIE